MARIVATEGKGPIKFSHPHHQRSQSGGASSQLAGAIYENYRVITAIFEKCGHLPLCLENYALFSLPPIFTTILYTYPLRCIMYLG